MDQGKAAVTAAAIAAIAALLGSLLSWIAAHKAAKGQVEAAIAGVKAQLSAQRQEALWIARRDTYASFLGQIEAVCMALEHMHGTCWEAQENLDAGTHGSHVDFRPAERALSESFKTLWLRESTLRLSVGNEEAQQAENLMKLARRAKEEASSFAGAVGDASQASSVLADKARATLDELRAGVAEWARTARVKLEQRQQAIEAR